MIECAGKNHGAFHETKVLRDVDSFRSTDDYGVANGVGAVLVDPQIEGGVVHVAHLFLRFGLEVQLHGISASPEKDFARFQTRREFEFVVECLTVGATVFEPFPLTFQHDLEIVSRLTDALFAFCCLLTFFPHGHIAVLGMTNVFI